MIIAIDGPAGTGKSSVAGIIARALGIYCADSGAIYRTLTLFGMKEYQDNFPNVLPRLEATLQNNPQRIRISFQESKQTQYIDNQEVGPEIRTLPIATNTRIIVQKPFFRDFVNSKLREMAKTHSLVVDGRDIGSVVFPNAEFKFYLDADLDVRTKRRASELNIAYDSQDFFLLKEEINSRDNQDKNRVVAPLIQTKDSIYIDTSNLDLKQVTQRILTYLPTNKMKYGKSL